MRASLLQRSTKQLLILLVAQCLILTACEEPPALGAEGFAVIGDAGRTNSNSDSVRKSIQRQGIGHLILPGDNLYSGSYSSVWKPWRDTGMVFDVVAIGNHNGGYSQEISYFGLPGEYYSKVANEARFIVLNSDNDNSGPAQATWLDQELTGAAESLIFLVYHHPTYTLSVVHRWEEKKKFQQALRPILWKHRRKITALLIGHDHLAEVLHFNDLPIILSGAVQDVRRDRGVDNVQDGVSVRTAWYFDDTPYWARLKLNAAQSTATVDFIRAKDDRVSCSVILTTGRQAELQPNCTR